MLEREASPMARATPHRPPSTSLAGHLSAPPEWPPRAASCELRTTIGASPTCGRRSFGRLAGPALSSSARLEASLCRLLFGPAEFRAPAARGRCARRRYAAPARLLPPERPTRAAAPTWNQMAPQRGEEGWRRRRRSWSSLMPCLARSLAPNWPPRRPETGRARPPLRRGSLVVSFAFHQLACSPTLER